MTIWVFGYGSLVNAGTQAPGTSLRSARLRGWRRVWRDTPRRALAYLSAEPCASSEIDGVIFAVPAAGLSALDAREAGYHRMDVSAAITCLDAPAPECIMTYWIPPYDDLPRLPLRQSYIDTVAQGYVHRFGPKGLRDWFDTTAGWAAPILQDRASPLYPRATVLTPAERAMIDAEQARVRS